MPTNFGFEIDNPFRQEANRIRGGGASPAPSAPSSSSPTISPALAKKITKVAVDEFTTPDTLQLDFGSNTGFLANNSSPWISSGSTDIVASSGFTSAVDGANISLGTLSGSGGATTGAAAGDLSIASNNFLTGSDGVSNLATAQSSSGATAGSFAGAAANAVGGFVGVKLAQKSGLGGGREGAAIGAVGGAAIGAQLGTTLWPGVGTAIGAFVGYIAGSFFGDDGDFPYARYAIKGGNMTLNDSLDGGPIEPVTQLGSATSGVLNSIANHYGIPLNSLPDSAIGVASGRKGSNLGEGIWTTINSNGSFTTTEDKVKNFDTPEQASADMVLRSLQFSNLAGADESMQEAILGYDGTNGVEILSEISLPVVDLQVQEHQQTIKDTGRSPEGVPLVRARRETDASTFQDALNRYKASIAEQGTA